MNELLKKLNFKKHEKVYIINAPEEFRDNLNTISETVSVEETLDNNDTYSFVLIFANDADDVINYAETTINNLQNDGILWFAYPKKSSKKYKSDLSRDFGWQPLKALGYEGVRLVSIDDHWSAFRFRHVDYIH